MDDPNVLERLRADWNERAAEDAYYYVAFGRREQDDDEFFATAADVVRNLTAELKRLPSRDAALEIGCGPGRLMRPMSRFFGEVHGIDVSDEMIRLARERLRDTPNAYPRHGSGSDLSMFPDGKFDFVYSYAVFQHIPSRDVVLNYLREARRVLKPGGILRCQLNGLPATAKQYDTWSGVRISADEIRRFAREECLQLLALEQVSTQYMWITCRKRAAVRIRNISNAYTGEAVAPASGPLAALSLWIEGLPAASDLNTLEVLADGRPCRVIYIGEPESGGLSQVNIALPEGLRTGLVPVEVRGVCDPGWIRIMPPGPSIPRILSLTDGVNLLSGNRIVTGSVKVTMSDVTEASVFHAKVDDLDALDIDAFCTDPALQRYEFNFRVPEAIRPGPHNVWITIGRRAFAPYGIEVV
jgi:SAM-dependent methyltransferase